MEKNGNFVRRKINKNRVQNILYRGMENDHFLCFLQFVKLSGQNSNQFNFCKNPCLQNEIMVEISWKAIEILFIGKLIKIGCRTYYIEGYGKSINDHFLCLQFASPDCETIGTGFESI